MPTLVLSLNIPLFLTAIIICMPLLTTLPFVASAGFPDVRMYMESAVGWCMDPRDLPLVTYGDHKILKETKWVFYWGVQAPPIMNETKIRIVDVRPVEAYNEGHIPFSFNLPIENFTIRRMCHTAGG